MTTDQGLPYPVILIIPVGLLIYFAYAVSRKFAATSNQLYQPLNQTRGDDDMELDDIRLDDDDIDIDIELNEQQPSSSSANKSYKNNNYEFTHTIHNVGGIYGDDESDIESTLVVSSPITRPHDKIDDNNNASIQPITLNSTMIPSTLQTSPDHDQCASKQPTTLAPPPKSVQDKTISSTHLFDETQLSDTNIITTTSTPYTSPISFKNNYTTDPTTNKNHTQSYAPLALPETVREVPITVNTSPLSQAQKQPDTLLTSSSSLSTSIKPPFNNSSNTTALKTAVVAGTQTIDLLDLPVQSVIPPTQSVSNANKFTLPPSLTSPQSMSTKYPTKEELSAQLNETSTLDIDFDDVLMNNGHSQTNLNLQSIAPANNVVQDTFDVDLNFDDDDDFFADVPDTTDTEKILQKSHSLIGQM